MPRKKPATIKSPGRAIGRTAVIWVNGEEQMVRDVDVVLHLVNGVDHVVKADEDVEVLQVQPVAITDQTEPDVGE